MCFQALSGIRKLDHIVVLVMEKDFQHVGNEQNQIHEPFAETRDELQEVDDELSPRPNDQLW